MHLPNTKLLLASCSQLLVRNGSTAVANQRPFACRTSSLSVPKLSPNRQQSSQLVTFGSEFSRHGSAVRTNGKLSQFQNGEKLNPWLLTVPGDDKQYRRCLTPNSVDYCCQRHYSRHLNPKRQFIIHSVGEKECDSQDKQIDEPVSVNRYSAIEAERSRTDRTPRSSAGELDKREVNDQRSTFSRCNSSNSSNTSFKFNATFSHRIESDQAVGSSTDKQGDSQVAASSSSTQQQHTPGRQDFSDLINVRSIYRNNLLNQSDQGDLKKMSGVSFKPKKALILTKFSRLEYERRRLADYTEEEVKESVSARARKGLVRTLTEKN